jgi:hypothetical protein
VTLFQTFEYSEKCNVTEIRALLDEGECEGEA